MADIIAVIPARSGSKGVPDKNIKLLAGRPLLAYSIAAARLVRGIRRVIVSTDSDRYADIAREYGAEVPFLRPGELARDSSTDYDVIGHTLNWLRGNERYQPTYLVYLRPTTPFREAALIEAAIELMRNDKDATGLRSVHEMVQPSYKTLEIHEGYLKCICTGGPDIDAANQPRQQYPRTYDPNGYVDIIRSSNVIENKKVFGNRVIAFMTPVVAEVDSQAEFAYLEYSVAKEPILVDRLFGSFSGKVR